MSAFISSNNNVLSSSVSLNFDPPSPSRVTMLPGSTDSSVPYAKMATPGPMTLEAEMQRVKVVFLGAQGVGKSSIIQQFVCNQFNEEYSPTRNRECFYPSIIINDHLYEVKIIDCPMIPYFPTNSLYEWSDYRGYGLRSASAYVLVYDVTNDESFQYVRTIHEQIAESLDLHEVPLFVVGNKQDVGSTCGTGDGGGTAVDKTATKREISAVVRKQWKCGYLECSAKHNWHIIALFKEVMRAVDCNDGAGHKHSSNRMQEVFRRNRCVIL